MLLYIFVGILFVALAICIGRKLYKICRAKSDIKLKEVCFVKLHDLSSKINRPEQEIIDFALESAVEATGSSIGYIYFVSEDEEELSLHAWSKSAMQLCSVQKYPVIFRTADTGLWGDPVRRREPVIIDDYSSAPGKKGCPEGHVEVKNHLGVPIFDEGRIVLLVGVGNKNGKYNEEDIKQLSLVMGAMWRIVQRKRVERDLLKAREELEARVKERTLELNEANEGLKRFKQLFSSTPDLLSLVGVIDGEKTYLEANDSYLMAFGIKKEDIIGKSVRDVVGEKIYDEVSGKGLQKAFSGEVVNFEGWLDLKAAGRRFMSVTYHPVGEPENGHFKYVAVSARDITERKEIEDELKIYSERLSLATRSGGVGIWEWDIHSNKLFWDEQMHKLYDYDPRDFPGTYEGWHNRLHPEDEEEAVRELMESIEKKGIFDYEFRIVIRDGSVRNIKGVGKVQLDDHGVPCKVTGLNWDITERKLMETEIMRLATTDSLTGAYNRREFMRLATAEFERGKRYDIPTGCIIFDIDHFKRINDTYGHDVGDEVLKLLVDECEKQLRNTDFFCRYGGEEFAAILPQTNSEEVFKTAERLRSCFKELVIPTPSGPIMFTVSFGATVMLEDDSSIEKTIKRADEALYEAKRNGRDRVVCDVC